MNFAPNQKNEILQKIESVAAQISTEQGVVLYDIELALGPQGQVLRVYIDKEGGISVDDCANVSRGLNEYLDANDPVPNAEYALEVSSPGIERPLRKTWHFEKAIGQKIWVKLNQSLEKFGCTDGKYKPAKSITEDLIGLENDNLKFMLNGQELLIPLSEVEKAKIAFSFNDNKNDKKPGHKNGNKKAKK